MNTQKDLNASWARLHREAETLAANEKLLTSMITRVILNAGSLSDAVKNLIAEKFACADADKNALMSILNELPPQEDIVTKDLQSILKNDPAAFDLITPFMFFKGFLGLQTYRLAHTLWQADRRHLATFLQGEISKLCGMDIHPAARIGSGVMMDHATGIVIGATAVVEDDVLFWHGVTLGGRGSDDIDRHPKIRKGVLLGAHSSIIGNIEIGAHAKIGAGSTVVSNVAPGDTVVGPKSGSITQKDR